MPSDSRSFPFASCILTLFFCFCIGAGIYKILSTSSDSDAPRMLPPGWRVIRPPHEVRALVLQRDLIWAGGTEGVFGLNRQTGQVIRKLDCNPPLEHVRGLAVDDKGALWIAHLRGLTRFDGASCRTLTKSDGLPDDRVNGVYIDRDGRLWAGTWSGAAVSDGNSWRVITSAQGLADDMVNVMLEDSKGGMWYGSYVAPKGGIARIQDGKSQQFNYDSGLPHNNVTSLLEDREGGVWAGTGFFDRGGAVRIVFDGQAWRIDRVLRGANGLAGEKVRSIYQDRDGVLWFGSENDGLARMASGSFLVLTRKDGLSHPEIKCMVQDAEGTLWIGTRDGVTSLNAAALKELAKSAGSASQGSTR